MRLPRFARIDVLSWSLASILRAVGKANNISSRSLAGPFHCRIQHSLRVIHSLEASELLVCWALPACRDYYLRVPLDFTFHIAWTDCDLRNSYPGQTKHWSEVYSRFFCKPHNSRCSRCLARARGRVLVVCIWFAPERTQADRSLSVRRCMLALSE